MNVRYALEPLAKFALIHPKLQLGVWVTEILPNRFNGLSTLASMIGAGLKAPRKPLKRFPKIKLFLDPKLKLGENERWHFK